MTRSPPRHADELRLRGLVDSYQRKIDVAPTRESELIELNRDYATLDSAYKSLLAKREDSKVAANLERRQIGEQFKVLDPARVPERPFSPNRLRINLMVSLAGLAFGIGLVGLLEYRDSSFKNDRDIARVLQLPVLALVPMMRSDRELQHSTPPTGAGHSRCGGHGRCLRERIRRVETADFLRR